MSHKANYAVQKEHAHIDILHGCSACHGAGYVRACSSMHESGALAIASALPEPQRQRRLQNRNWQPVQFQVPEVVDCAGAVCRCFDKSHQAKLVWPCVHTGGCGLACLAYCSPHTLTLH
jgi:hypothetical protein